MYIFILSYFKPNHPNFHTSYFKPNHSNHLKLILFLKNQGIFEVSLIKLYPEEIQKYKHMYFSH